MNPNDGTTGVNIKQAISPHSRKQPINVVVSTPLMCVEVAAIVPPYSQALLRCAGSVGVDVYEEVVARGKAPLYFEHTCTSPGDSEGDTITHHTPHPRRPRPTTLPITTLRIPTVLFVPINPSLSTGELPTQDDTVTLVITHMFQVNQDNTLGALNVHPANRLKYIGAGGEREPALAWFTSFGLGIAAVHKTITSVEFFGVENVRHIPDNFLVGCESLKNLDMSVFRKLQSVGANFTFKCKALTSIRFVDGNENNNNEKSSNNVGACHGGGVASDPTFIDDPLPTKHHSPPHAGGPCTITSSSDLTEAVTDISYGFLQGCHSLTSIDLCPFANMTHICRMFMAGCGGLTSIDLNPLSKVTTVGNHFMSGCTSLTSIDLSPFANVTKLGDSFMNFCTALTSIDLHALSNLKEVGDGLAWGCTALISIDITPFAKNVSTLGKSFMYDCSSLVSIEMGNSAFQNITTIGDNFMHNCSSLSSIDLTPFVNIKEVGISFLAGCFSLTSVDLHPLRRITHIPLWFMKGCSSLTVINISPLSNVTSIHQHFMADCSALTSIDFSPFANVTTIGSHFMENCASLESIDLTPMIKLPNKLGKAFAMKGCTTLHINARRAKAAAAVTKKVAVKKATVAVKKKATVAVKKATVKRKTTAKKK